MAYFGSSFSADSPVLTISPQTAHQAMSLGFSTGMGPYSHPSSLNHSMPFTSSDGRSFPPQHQTPQRPTGAGRKRSRDEADVNLCDDAPEPIPIEPVKEPEEDWIYGEGMVLIKPGSGYVADASSQSGTWVEEQAAAIEEARKAEALAALQRQQQDRPALRSHKSQRLEHSDTISPGQDAPVSCPSPDTITPGVAPILPTLAQDIPSVVDALTLHLGIGWKRISEDEHIQAAARGWARFIENHYPLSQVVVRLESKGLQSYLVESAEGFFLFTEDLRQGRLVSNTVDGVMRNLKSNPPTYDSPGTFMMAAESPRATENAASIFFPSTTAMEGDIEMEVC